LDVSKTNLLELFLTSNNVKEVLSKMKFLTILSVVVFSAFAVAGPMQADSQVNGKVEKRQVLNPLPFQDDLRIYRLTETGCE
jgi:hypothetical protein